MLRPKPHGAIAVNPLRRNLVNSPGTVNAEISLSALNVLYLDPSRTVLNIGRWTGTASAGQAEPWFMMPPAFIVGRRRCSAETFDFDVGHVLLRAVRSCGPDRAAA